MDGGDLKHCTANLPDILKRLTRPTVDAHKPLSENALKRKRRQSNVYDAVAGISTCSLVFLFLNVQKALR